MPLISIKHTNPARALMAAKPFIGNDKYIVMGIAKPKNKKHYVINIFGAKS